MHKRPTVADWATDFDHLDPRWIENPYPIWDQLRGDSAYWSWLARGAGLGSGAGNGRDYRHGHSDGREADDDERQATHQPRRRSA